MWNPRGNTLPSCKWPEHDWKLQRYEVVTVSGHCQVVQVYECPVCKRLNIVKMDWEPA